MARDEIRAFAAEQNGGVDDPEPGYDIDPTNPAPQHWLAVARHAKTQRDSRMLGWLRRHCPEVHVPGYAVPLTGVIDAWGLAVVAEEDR